MAEQGNRVEELQRLVGAFAAELGTSTMPYVGEALLGAVTLTEMSDADKAAGAAGVAIGSRADENPMVFNVQSSTELRWEATALKRSGHFLESAEKTIQSFRLDGHYDLGNLRNLWKTALCGGDARGALEIIQKAVDTYERYEVARREQLPYPPHDDLADILGCLRSEQSCADRLRDLSGNPAYVLPRSYAAMRAEVQGVGASRNAGAPSSQLHKTSDGCYVATAVYGSYDAPEVVVLRRFRDERLRRMILGRCLIAVYYSLSPSLARHLPKFPIVSAKIRRVLDFLVDRLRTSL